MKGKSELGVKPGPKRVFDINEEKHLTDFAVSVLDRGFALSKDFFLDEVAFELQRLQKPNSFKDGRPGRIWLEAFTSRHPDITWCAQADLISKEDDVNGFSEQWRNQFAHYLHSNDFDEIDVSDSRRIFSISEIIFHDSPDYSEVLTRSASNFLEIQTKIKIHMLIGGNANGSFLNPMLITQFNKTLSSELPSNWLQGNLNIISVEFYQEMIYQ